MSTLLSGSIETYSISGFFFRGGEGDNLMEGGANYYNLSIVMAPGTGDGLEINGYSKIDFTTAYTTRGRFSSAGDFYTNDGTVSSLSDIRAKKDVNDLTDGLSIIDQLRPITFKYNGAGDMTGDDGIQRYGFIADEVLPVASQYVSVFKGKINGEEVDDVKSLSTTRMIPMMMKAIQELSAKVTALEDG